MHVCTQMSQRGKVSTCSLHLRVSKLLKKKKSAYYKERQNVSRPFSCTQLHFLALSDWYYILLPFKRNCRDFPSILSFQFRSFCRLGSIVLNLLCCGWIPEWDWNTCRKVFQGWILRTKILHYWYYYSLYVYKSDGNCCASMSACMCACSA